MESPAPLEGSLTLWRGACADHGRLWLFDHEVRDGRVWHWLYWAANDSVHGPFFRQRDALDAGKMLLRRHWLRLSPSH